MSSLAAISRPEPRLGQISLTRGFLYLLILAFPFFSIEPKISRPDWWVGGALILTFALSFLLRGKLRVDPIGRAVLGFHGAILLSVAVNFWGWEAAQWTEFLTLWLQLVFASLLYFALANFKLSSAQLRIVLRLWIGMAVVVSLYGLYQALARNLDLPLAYLPYLHSIPTEKQLQAGLGYGGYVRPSSFLREPTYLGMYLLAPLLVTAVLVFRRDKTWLFRSQRLNYTLLLLLLSALLASFALAAYITLVALLFLSFLLNRFTRQLTLRLTLTLVLISAAFVVAFEAVEVPFLQGLTTRSSLIMDALLGGEIEAAGPSVPTRYWELALALSTWVHHPIFGVGLNQLQFTGVFHAPESIRLRIVERGYTHNMWLAALVLDHADFIWYYSLHRSKLWRGEQCLGPRNMW